MHLVVINHAAELVDLVVQEGALLWRELGLVRVEQCLERRGSTKDLPVETDGSAAKRDLLRLADLGHHLLGEVVARARDEGPLALAPADSAGDAAHHGA